MSSSIFDVRVSLYRDSFDRDGGYVDPATRQVCRSLTMGEFLFGGYWQDEVEAYRKKLLEVAAEKGSLGEAKKDKSVSALKSLLPAATLSGYFENRRRTDLLTAYTGFIALDIDYQDNRSLEGNGDDLIFVLKHRPEVAAVLKSCSGTGYFAMVRLARPDKLKEHFYALFKEYANMGIRLDAACSDVTRLRYASWDAAPYINEGAVPYQGMVEFANRDVLQRRHELNAQRQNVGYTKQRTIALVDGLVKKIVATHTNICELYPDWVNCGFALSRFDADLGRGWFHAISSMSGKYDPQVCDKQYHNCLRYPDGKIGIGYFINRCRDFGVRLYEDRSLKQ